MTKKRNVYLGALKTSSSVCRVLLEVVGTAYKKRRQSFCPYFRRYLFNRCSLAGNVDQRTDVAERVGHELHRCRPRDLVERPTMEEGQALNVALIVLLRVIQLHPSSYSRDYKHRN
jgi:hypothetical protein